jgi:hypothetical protein
MERFKFISNIFLELLVVDEQSSCAGRVVCVHYGAKKRAAEEIATRKTITEVTFSALGGFCYNTQRSSKSLSILNGLGCHWYRSRLVPVCFHLLKQPKLSLEFF